VDIDFGFVWFVAVVLVVGIVVAVVLVAD